MKFKKLLLNKFEKAGPWSKTLLKSLEERSEN